MRSLAAALVLVLAAGSAAVGGPARSVKPKPKPTRPLPAKPRPRPAEPPAGGPAEAPRARPAKDVRKTLETVIVRRKPGEKQAAVATLQTGTEVIVEAEEGRWLRVRAGRVAGYLARTTVSDPAPPAAATEPPAASAATAPAATASATAATAATEAPAAATGAAAAGTGRTNAWSAARRLDPAKASITELFVEVTAEAAVLRTEARPEAGVVARVARGARLAVAEVTESGWLRARDAAGATGWIARAEVGNGSAAVVASSTAGEPAAPRTAATAEVAGRPARLALRADAGIGYRTFGMSFQSNGTGGLANYLVTSGAGAADLSIDLVARPGRWRIGADARVQLSRSSPGIEYTGPTSEPGTIAFGTFGADAGVRVGARVRSLFELSLRAGGHYDAFVATDVENAGRLPRERLLGATAGVRADIAPPRSRVSAAVRVDALVLGSRRQTPGLEDGTDSTVRAVWAGATLRVRIGGRFSILGAYDFGRITTRWSGMSVREPGATEARRSDGSQLVQIGLGAEL